MERITYSIAETGAVLGIGRTLIYEMLDDGRLEAIKVGRRTLVKADSIKRLVDGAS